MKKAVILICSSLALLTAAAPIGENSKAEETPSQAVQSLPRSLEKLYPPSADGPTWLFAKFALAESFSGMVTDFMEGDYVNAEQEYGVFRDRYAKMSQMVPEWTTGFPMEPIDALNGALETKDPAKFMAAVDGASNVCHSCHVVNMARVQQKYHWGDFGVLLLTDPVSKGDMPFTAFMRILDGDLSGAKVDLAQGQIDRARDHAMGLATRYATLRESCDACHDSERSYYVDSRVTGMIEMLQAVLSEATVDPQRVEELLQGIGMESCHKCHLVHAPAALARYAEEPAK